MARPRRDHITPMNASSPLVGGPKVIWLPMTRLVPISVQPAFTRQDANERGERDDVARWSDDSYSPHTDTGASEPDDMRGSGVAYRWVISFDDDSRLGVCFDSRLVHPAGLDLSSVCCYLFFSGRTMV